MKLEFAICQSAMHEIRETGEYKIVDGRDVVRVFLTSRGLDFLGIKDEYSTRTSWESNACIEGKTITDKNGNEIKYCPLEHGQHERWNADLKDRVWADVYRFFYRFFVLDSSLIDSISKNFTRAES